MKYLALDPSSSCIGWALMDSGRRGKITDADRILAPRKGNYLYRVDWLIEQLKLLMVTRLNPGPSWRWVDRVIIEIPSGRTHGRHRGRGEGLSVYGFAVGAIREACIAGSACGEVFSLTEAEWKSGQPKEKAIRVATKHYPEYAGMVDPGVDIADAIALAVWYYEFHLRRRRQK